MNAFAFLQTQFACRETLTLVVLFTRQPSHEIQHTLRRTSFVPAIIPKNQTLTTSAELPKHPKPSQQRTMYMLTRSASILLRFNCRKFLPEPTAPHLPQLIICHVSVLVEDVRSPVGFPMHASHTLMLISALISSSHVGPHTHTQLFEVPPIFAYTRMQTCTDEGT